MGSEFNKSHFPHLRSGVVDSCEGYNFPQCPSWQIEADGGHYYHDVVVKTNSTFEDSPSVVYTTIAGIHTPNAAKENPSRSLECKVSGQKSGEFTIRMR